MFQDRLILDVNSNKTITLETDIMKIFFFNIAPFISKTMAAFEREIIQIINDFDLTLNKTDFFPSTDLTPEFKL
jgi:hypothetical protein